MNKGQTIVSKEGSIVWAMLRGPKGLVSIGKFQSIKKATARCQEWADKVEGFRFIRVARSHDEMKEMLNDHPL